MKPLVILATKNKPRPKPKPKLQARPLNQGKSQIPPLDFDVAFKALKKNYPDAHCALDFNSPFQLLIATILSAQCTDIRVNIVTKELFKKLPDAQSMADADLVQIEQLIHSTGFYKNKAKNIQECCRMLVEKHQGVVPKTMEALYELAGVGRKTANVVLGNAFGIASGVVVDTHVNRLAIRFGWVKTLDAVRTENTLNMMVPEKVWIVLPHYLISHGRAICKARNPACSICFLNSACPKHGV